MGLLLSLPLAISIMTCKFNCVSLLFVCDMFSHVVDSISSLCWVCVAVWVHKEHPLHQISGGSFGNGCAHSLAGSYHVRVRAACSDGNANSPWAQQDVRDRWRKPACSGSESRSVFFCSCYMFWSYLFREINSERLALIQIEDMSIVLCVLQTFWWPNSDQQGLDVQVWRGKDRIAVRREDSAIVVSSGGVRGLGNFAV